jgi:integrase/recombinase XerD
MSDFNELFFSFTERLRVKNYSPSTRAAYTTELRFFFDYLKEKGVSDIKSVTVDLLKEYQLALFAQKEAKGLTVAYVCMKTRAVKRFFEHLEASGLLLVNPAEQIKEPKIESRLPRAVLTEDEARNIMNQPKLKTLIGVRDRCVLEVLYSTGVRLEELTNLTIFDCDLQGGLLRVNKGKGSKDRVVPMGKHAVRFLKEYIAKVRPHYTRTNRQLKTLFMNHLCRPLAKQTVEVLVKNYAKQAGVQKQVTPHVFRHTFATELLRNGADITSVQKMLGHADLRNTHIYTRVAGCDVKKTHSMSHPREKDKDEKPETLAELQDIRRRYHHEQS